MTKDEIKKLYKHATGKIDKTRPGNLPLNYIGGIIDAVKLLPKNHPNRKYIIKMAMDNNLDDMLKENKHNKKKLNKNDGKLGEEAQYYDFLLNEEKKITKGEESFRKRKQQKGKARKRVGMVKVAPTKLNLSCSKSKEAENKILDNMRSIGGKTNKTRRRVVENINGLRYNKK